MERGAGEAFSRANAARIESTRASSLADAQTQIDVATFTQWVDAYAQHQTRLADFYFKRFRTEFKPAVDAWIATKPQRNPNAPLTPFAMPQYQLAARAEATELEAKADASSAEAVSDVQRATDYVLGVVLFAATLFFAGMSAKFPDETSPRRSAHVRRRPLRRHNRLDRHVPRQHFGVKPAKAEARAASSGARGRP